MTPWRINRHKYRYNHIPLKGKKKNARIIRIKEENFKINPNKI